MGTAASFTVRGGDGASEAVAAACRWLHQVDATYSTYRSESVVSRLRAGAIGEEGTPSEVQRVLKRCRELHMETAGAFDVYAPGRVDPSGYVKGWSVQRAAGILSRAGLTDFMINVGGDLVVRGDGEAEREGWRIGIANPAAPQTLVAVTTLRDQTMATSGCYERGNHVELRRGAEPLDSVTVVGDDLGEVDAWATAILAGGKETLRLAIARPDLDVLVIDGDRICASPGFPMHEHSPVTELSSGAGTILP